jgi:alkaline phosphatase
MSSQTAPKIRDFEAFYVYGENLRMNLLGRVVANQQHITWGAGTHTSTPVILGAYGPATATSRFTGMLHSTEVGQRMIELLGGSSAPTDASASAP